MRESVSAFSAALLMLLGAGSIIVQAVWFPWVETRDESLIGLWVASAGFFAVGGFILMHIRASGLFLVISTLTAAALVIAITVYALTGNQGVVKNEFIALVVYAVCLVIFIMVGCGELSRSI